MRDVVISLCDLTGNMVAPWVAAGYSAVIVDPQHKTTRREGRVLKVAGTVQSSRDIIEEHLPRAAFVAAFPPCTDLASSGARWWKRKAERDPRFQTRAANFARLCARYGERSGAPWMLENPIGRLSALWRKFDHRFHPWEYAGHEPDDCYVKLTCLWTGGGFVMPPPFPIGAGVLAPPVPDERIHRAPEAHGRANLRSATPRGFARAVFEANSRKNFGL